MSQEKVERNKALKANRKSINAKKKMQSAIYSIVGIVVCVVIVGWIGFSVYDKQANPEGTEASTKVAVDINPISDYISGIVE